MHRGEFTSRLRRDTPPNLACRNRVRYHVSRVAIRLTGARLVTAFEKPGAIFDRRAEWDDLVRFVRDEAPGLKLGIVRGRRRHGKSFLLEHLCRAAGGVYTLAVRQSRVMALDRFARSLSDALGFNVGRFENWVDALDTAVDVLVRTSNGHVPILVLDEFPYLAAHSEELPSVIQALYDRRGPSTGHPAFKLILCGSALSVMSTLIAGDQALFGRAVLDLRVGPFRHRDSAAYWSADPETAFLIDATVGGAPGYRDIIGESPGASDEEFFTWLERSILNPSHVLFTEPDYILAEDPRISDRAIYHAIWETVSNGATTPTKIGAIIGMDAKSLTYHLGIMRSAGFIHHDLDILLQRRPVITVADPTVRFHNLIVRPNLADLEMRNAEIAWARAAPTFSAQILGPHFEHLAREWTTWHAREAGLDNIGHVGTTVVACRQHHGHVVDVVALDRSSMPRTKGARITLLGEAKATSKVRNLHDLNRLEHIRDILTDQGWNAADAELAIFSRSGFADDVPRDVDGIHLLDLADIYGVTTRS
ncbi:ATP-binding protein [Phytoactinopolyspora halotolerans]|uniref:ATPase n=1 Tax=Phytoactinopolyspora halotolerans TaxID=1981512 RepID=A0A6L9S955_9ACTN|nr:ATPase [Phytoactinopolyspora halotolerans]NEE01221.1 ATPase [Phytoactinopolyspora halotolerans]